jgi:hypothetical protein
MRLAKMATGTYHEARENGERLYGSGSATEHEEEAKARWYYGVEDIKYLHEAGENESNRAQQTQHPGYSKLETGSFQNLDWRGRYEPIVSPFVLIQCCRPLPLLSLLHAGSCRSQHYCVIFNSIVPVVHFYCQEALPIAFLTFLSHSLPGNLLLNPPTTSAFLQILQNNNNINPNRLLQVN